MFLFTHLFISKVLYQHFSKEVELNKRAFSYGNIKPDIPSAQRSHHTLENCLYTVCDYSNQLMNNELSMEEFSVRLGEICHYVSDFFCYYHLNEDLHNRNLQHFIYEIRLHMRLYHFPQAKKYKALASKKEPRKNIHSIILEMRKSYLSQPKSFERDMEYALLANVWIYESIVYFNKYTSDIAKEDQHILNAVSFAKGGNL